MMLADAPGGELYRDAVYGASTFAVAANLLMIGGWLAVAWRLRSRWGSASHAEVLVWSALVVSQVVVHGEQALHAFGRSGASWQVTEHGLLFLGLWSFAVVGLAVTAPWDHSHPRRRRRSLPVRRLRWERPDAGDRTSERPEGSR